ncbi:MAG: sigma-70 family RNA polymerase sigma factor [Candidatus Omnitrophica bacterium]|nr:sigma-70 family RNA polymerase sigma factor [Candidatus Omnitrophota bacterium]
MKKVKCMLNFPQEDRPALSIRSSGHDLFRDKLIRSNLNLVIDIARSFSDYEILASELIEEGINRLSESADRFNPQNGYRFSTYAAWWIKHGLSELVASKKKNLNAA